MSRRCTKLMNAEEALEFYWTINENGEIGSLKFPSSQQMKSTSSAVTSVSMLHPTSVPTGLTIHSTTASVPPGSVFYPPTSVPTRSVINPTSVPCVLHPSSLPESAFHPTTPAPSASILHSTMLLPPGPVFYPTTPATPGLLSDLTASLPLTMFPQPMTSSMSVPPESVFNRPTEPEIPLDDSVAEDVNYHCCNADQHDPNETLELFTKVKDALQDLPGLISYNKYYQIPHKDINNFESSDSDPMDDNAVQCDFKINQITEENPDTDSDFKPISGSSENEDEVESKMKEKLLKKNPKKSSKSENLLITGTLNTDELQEESEDSNEVVNEEGDENEVEASCYARGSKSSKKRTRNQIINHPMQAPCSCKRKCLAKIDDNCRKGIHSQFWS